MADASNTSGNAPAAVNMPANQISFRQSSINPNATSMDLRARYGGGCYAVCHGLALSAGAGLNLNISAGHAMCDGILEVPAATSTVVSASHPGPTDRAWIWLCPGSGGGATYTIQKTYNTLTPPTGACVLIGSCTTSGTGITAVDTSGVLYLQGPLPIRYVADTGAPTDSASLPALLQFITQTAFCSYYWTGSKYAQMYIPEVTADQASPQAGDIWFRSDLLQMSYYTGSAVKRSAAFS
jgi:hypothetical protein